MTRARPKADLSKPASVKAFKAWLNECGAEVLPETNAYELVRFRCGAGLSIIYTNNRGRSEKMTGLAHAAWIAFKAGESLDLRARYFGPNDRPIPSTDEAIVEHAAGRPITVAFLMELDQVAQREAACRLFALERAGRLVRAGGGRGEPLTWSAAIGQALGVAA